MNKINLIFDIDATLINTLDFNFNNHQVTDIGNIEDFKVGIINWASFLFLVFLRPYLPELLTFCYKNFNVGFWTAGHPLYCKEILKLILNEEQINLTNIILARDGTDYVNLKNNTTFNDINKEDIKKPLESIWEDNNLMETFKPENTILIDDNLKICCDNPLNSINIPRFDRFSKEDDVLLRLQYLLDFIKDLSDVRIIEKNINTYSSGNL